jgi:hypothetical protein
VGLAEVERGAAEDRGHVGVREVLGPVLDLRASEHHDAVLALPALDLPAPEARQDDEPDGDE